MPKHHFSDFPTDNATQVVFYAMPCASVLILELLRQIDRPQQHIPIRRSTLIQDLSVLISCCDWLTAPGQQNYSLCKRAQSIFSRSMDRILNAPTTPSAAQQNPHMLVCEPEWKAWLEVCNVQADPWLAIVADAAQGYSDESQCDGTNSQSGHA